MTHRYLLLVAGLAMFAAAALTQAQSAKPVRTASGQPDLQGVWINPTLTPFERAASMEGKAKLTKQEMGEIETRARANQVDRAPQSGDPGTYNQAWFDGGTTWLSTGQTSLVVEPSSGRVPIKPSALAQRDYDLLHVTDAPEYQTTWDRCITRGVPAGMFPAGYNNAYHIVQTADTIAILSEMIHETRIIPIGPIGPINGRPHLPSNIKQWNGDSRGHWEGNTLVVDTTNYNGKGMIATSAATARVKGIHQSEALHVVERFQRIDDKTLNYEVTITDPEIFSAPWKVSMPLSRDPNYLIYEYACHEGNHAMENILSGGRLAEKAAAQKAAN